MSSQINPSRLEPGLLQVFRIYAWLRLISVVFLWVEGFLGGPGQGLVVDARLAVAFSAATALLLLLFLYWPPFKRRTGRWFLPSLLILATGALVIEQQMFSYRGLFWQGNPFLSILVILVAWQYTFRMVAVYVILTNLVDLALISLLPAPEMQLLLIPGLERALLFGLVVARTITFFVLGYVVTRLSDAQRQQRQALAEANQKLVQHAETLEQLTISRERLRLSRELHDTLAHTLSAMTVQIEALLTIGEGLPSKALGILEGMAKTARSGLDETRRALSALRAAPLEEWGLAVALRSYAADFAARNSMELELNLPDNLDDLPAEVEQAYYRIAQEALENTARHARAGRLAVSMEQRSGSLCMTIADDGEGFDPGKTDASRQFGLLGMHERAELIGARLEIESRPGQGTLVQVRLEQKA
jgi:signal transduction histidine kinase